MPSSELTFCVVNSQPGSLEGSLHILTYRGDLKKFVRRLRIATAPMSVALTCLYIPRWLTFLFSQMVYNAIKVGYRLFDGAGDYGNEKEAGEGVRRALEEGIVKREELCERYTLRFAISF